MWHTDSDLTELRGLLVRSVEIIDKRLGKTPPPWSADAYYSILEGVAKAGESGLHWKEWYELGKNYGYSPRGLAGFFNRVAERTPESDYVVRLTEHGKQVLANRPRP